MNTLTGLDGLICTEPPLAARQFFGLPGGVSSRTSSDLKPWNWTNSGHHLHLIIKGTDWSGRNHLERASASQSYRIADWTELAFSVRIDYTLSWPLCFSLSFSLATLTWFPSELIFIWLTFSWTEPSLGADSKSIENWSRKLSKTLEIAGNHLLSFCTFL